MVARPAWQIVKASKEKVSVVHFMALYYIVATTVITFKYGHLEFFNSNGA